LSNLKLDRLALVEGFEAIALDRGVMNKDIAALSLSINPYPFELLNHLTLPVAIN